MFTMDGIGDSYQAALNILSSQAPYHCCNLPLKELILGAYNITLRPGHPLIEHDKAT
jgi:hypothetical protein